MFEVTTECHFDAAHYLRNYEGKCARVHGHRWIVKATFRSQTLIDYMVIDFTKIKAVLNKLIESQFDHYLINDNPPFTVINPTAEKISEYIFDVLSANLQGLYSVEVFESPTSSAKYWVE